MERGTRELKEGVQSARNLINMAGEALETQGKPTKSTIGWNWIGWYIDSKKAWIGINWDNPSILVFETEELSVTKEAANAVELGEAEAYSEAPTGWRWAHKLDLESEDVHFFALSCACQQARIEQFIKESLEVYGKWHSPSR